MRTITLMMMSIDMMQFDDKFIWLVSILLFIGIFRVFYNFFVVRFQKNKFIKNQKFNWQRLIEPLRKNTQSNTVTSWIEEVGFFPPEAADYYGIKNLSAVISTIQQKGVPIESILNEQGKVILYIKKKS